MLADITRRGFGTVGRMTFILIGGLLSWALLRELMLWSQVYPHSPFWPPLLYGFGGYTLLWLVWFHPKTAFFETLEHEFTHTIFHWLFGQKVVELRVQESGNGEVTSHGQNPITLLAPYVFPTFIIPLVILKPALTITYLPVLVFITGVALAYHFTSTLRELKTPQTDLQKVGYLTSLPIISSLNLLTIGVTVSYLLFGFEGLEKFTEGTWQQIQLVARKALDWISQVKV